MRYVFRMRSSTEHRTAHCSTTWSTFNRLPFPEVKSSSPLPLCSALLWTRFAVRFASLRRINASCPQTDPLSNKIGRQFNILLGLTVNIIAYEPIQMSMFAHDVQAPVQLYALAGVVFGETMLYWLVKQFMCRHHWHYFTRHHSQSSVSFRFVRRQ